MPDRLHVRKLKPDEPTPPDVHGWSTTLTLPNKLPNLQQAHSTMQSFHEQAPLIVAILAAGATIFPSPQRRDEPKSPRQPKRP